MYKHMKKSAIPSIDHQKIRQVWRKVSSDRIGKEKKPNPTASHNTTPEHCTKNYYIHHVTTMQATSKTILFPGHNHLLTTGTDDPTL